MADFIQFKDGIGDVVTDIVQKEVGTAKNEILASNDKMSKKLDKVLTEQAAISGNVDEYRDEVKGLAKRVKRLEAHAGIS